MMERCTVCGGLTDTDAYYRFQCDCPSESSAYTLATSRAVAILDERCVNGTSVALIRTTVSPTRYAVVTSGGGSQTGIRTEASGRFHFDSWVRSIERRAVA